MLRDGMAGPVEELREVRLRECHPDGVTDALPERTRCGLHPRREPVLRVPRGPAPPLAELLDVVEREIVPGQVENRIQQHAGVAGRKHEAVASEPIGIRGIVAEVSLP